MGQERVFRIRVDERNFFTGRDLTSGQVYGSPQISAGLLMKFDVAAAIVARLNDVGYDEAAVTDITGRPVNVDNDRPSGVPDEDLDAFWGRETLGINDLFIREGRLMLLGCPLALMGN